MEPTSKPDAKISDAGILQDAELESIAGGGNRRAFDHIGNIAPGSPPAVPSPIPAPGANPGNSYFDDMMQGTNI